MMTICNIFKFYYIQAINHPGADLVHRGDFILFVILYAALFFKAALCDVLLEDAVGQLVQPFRAEAARSLGLSARQTMMRIILPQAFKNVLPAMCNEFVAVTKETSLASTFYVGDLMTQYQTISGKTYLVIEPLVIIGVIYFVVTFSMSKLITVLERRLKNDD